MIEPGFEEPGDIEGAWFAVEVVGYHVAPLIPTPGTRDGASFAVDIVNEHVPDGDEQPTPGPLEGGGLGHIVGGPIAYENEEFVFPASIAATKPEKFSFPATVSSYRKVEASLTTKVGASRAVETSLYAARGPAVHLNRALQEEEEILLLAL